MLITLAAAWPEVVAASGPSVGARRDMLSRWFWCATFLQRYENQTNSRTQTDVPILRAWLSGGPTPPEITDGSFAPEQFRSVTYRQKALYRASVALLLRHEPKDFHGGKALTAQRIEDEQIDDHHIFPRGFLKKIDSIPATLVDCVLNRTLIDKKTNIVISDKAPSTYLGEMRAKMPPNLLSEILDSHGLPSAEDGPLYTDDFDGFLAWRQTRIAQELSIATGWPLS
jgi:hypothetical protein